MLTRPRASSAVGPVVDPGAYRAPTLDELPVLDGPDRRERCAGCGDPYGCADEKVWRWRASGVSVHIGCRVRFERHGHITPEERRHLVGRRINEGTPTFRTGRVGETCTWCHAAVTGEQTAHFRAHGYVVDFDCLVAAVRAAGEKPARRPLATEAPRCRVEPRAGVSR